MMAIDASHDNFMCQWLKPERIRDCPGIIGWRLCEEAAFRDVAIPCLAGACSVHLRDPDEYTAEVTEILEDAGFRATAVALGELEQASDEVQKGMVGEVLAGEYLQQFEGYRVPVYRLRYRFSRTVSPPGEDVIAVRVEGDQVDVCVVEAKVRGQFQSHAVEEALDQLRRYTDDPRPQALMLIREVLWDRGERDMWRVFVRLGDPSHPDHPGRRYLIFLVTGNRPRQPFGAVKDVDHGLDDLHGVSLSLTHLDAVIFSALNTEVDVSEL